MSLNPAGTNTSFSWNMSRENDPDFSLELYGTVVSIQEVQAREYNANSNQPGRPRFWPDGNPVMNIRIGLADPQGQLKSVTFAKAGRKQVSGEKPSLHMQLFALTNNNMMELMGKTLHLWTWKANPTTGQQWGQGNPRLFGVEEVTDAKYELSGELPPEFTVPQLLLNDAASGGQVSQPQPQPQQMYQQPLGQLAQQYPVPQPMYPQQQMYQQQPAQQPMYPQPAQQPMAQPQMPQYQPVQQSYTQPVIQQPQMTAQMPVGMDPAVAQAMQQLGATNVQEVTPYNLGELPFEN